MQHEEVGLKNVGLTWRTVGDEHDPVGVGEADSSLENDPWHGADIGGYCQRHSIHTQLFWSKNTLFIWLDDRAVFRGLERELKSSNIDNAEVSRRKLLPSADNEKRRRTFEHPGLARLENNEKVSAVLWNRDAGDVSPPVGGKLEDYGLAAEIHLRIGKLVARDGDFYLGSLALAIRCVR